MIRTSGCSSDHQTICTLQARPLGGHGMHAQSRPYVGVGLDLFSDQVGHPNFSPWRRCRCIGRTRAVREYDREISRNSASEQIKHRQALSSLVLNQTSFDKHKPEAWCLLPRGKSHVNLTPLAWVAAKLVQPADVSRYRVLRTASLRSSSGDFGLPREILEITYRGKRAVYSWKQAEGDATVCWYTHHTLSGGKSQLSPRCSDTLSSDLVTSG